MNQLFIDRDGKTFRWILYWYRTQILVDHNAVKVPLELWEAELRFYGIGEQEMTNAGVQTLGDMSPTKRKLSEEEHNLSAKVAKTIENEAFKKEQEASERRGWYAKIVDYMVDNYNKSGTATFQFVGAPVVHVDPRTAFNPAWLTYWWNREFHQYCKNLGINVSHMFRDSTVRKNYDFEPAKSCSPIAVKHCMLQVTINYN